LQYYAQYTLATKSEFDTFDFVDKVEFDFNNTSPEARNIVMPSVYWALQCYARQAKC